MKPNSVPSSVLDGSLFDAPKTSKHRRMLWLSIGPTEGNTQEGLRRRNARPRNVACCRLLLARRFRSAQPFHNSCAERAVVAIAPVAAAKAKAPPVAVDVPAPWSDRQAGIGEPLIAGGVDAAIDFAPQPYRTWLASAGGPFDWARTGPAPHISTTAMVRLTTTGRKPDP